MPTYAKTFVYVSAAEDGVIDSYQMDPGSGVLTPLGKAEAGKLVMPMALSPNTQFLYAVVRSQPYQVITYAIDRSSGILTEKATAPLPDSMPYVSTDRTGRFLLTASYGGDKVAVSPIDPDGLVRSGAVQVIPTGKNAHAILPDRTNRFVYATNLGSDQILQFLFDAGTGKLRPNDPPLVKVRPGNGPRHLVVSPDNKYLYV
jgi:6-phosphogluconolactonase